MYEETLLRIFVAKRNKGTRQLKMGKVELNNFFSKMEGIAEYFFITRKNKAILLTVLPTRSAYF